MHIDVIL